jgi:hypothetical protein
MGRKILGIVVFLIGTWLFYVFRHDQGEGPFMRPVGFLAATGGLFLFLEGLKQEIVDAIQESRDSNRDVTRQDQH